MTELSDFSGWIEPPADLTEPLGGPQCCEVAIVGGGYTGLSAALRLAEAGTDVALVEARFCGWSASSRNAGHLTPTIGGDPNMLATVFRGRAGELVRFADAAVDFTQELIGRLGIDCDYEPAGNVYAALSRGQLRRSRRIAATLAARGADVRFVDEAGEERLGLPSTVLGGVLEQRGGHLNPGKFCRGLRAAVLASPARVFEGSPVNRLDATRSGVRIELAGGTLEADRVLVATNAHSRALGIPTRRGVRPLWVTLAETEPAPAGALDELGWTSRAGLYTQHLVLESYRPTAAETIVFGSRRVQVGGGALDPRMPQERMVAEIRRGFDDRFPELHDLPLRAAWGGWIAMTTSLLPLVGQRGERLWYSVGCNGHGLAQAPFLGNLVAGRMLGEESETLATVWRDRRPFVPAVQFSRPALAAGWALDRMGDRLGRV